MGERMREGEENISWMHVSSRYYTSKEGTQHTTQEKEISVSWEVSRSSDGVFYRCCVNFTESKRKKSREAFFFFGERKIEIVQVKIKNNKEQIEEPPIKCREIVEYRSVGWYIILCGQCLDALVWCARLNATEKERRSSCEIIRKVECNLDKN